MNKIERNKLVRCLINREINKKLFAKAEPLVDKILSSPRIKHSNPKTIFLDGVETGVLLSDFAQQLRCKIAAVPDLYSTLLDSDGISPTLVLNQNAKTKKRQSWAPFKISTSEVSNALHAAL